MTLPAISKHLKVLERAGLIERDREAQYRPSRLRVGQLGGASDWIESRRRTWQQRLDHLDAHLKSLQKGTQGR